MAATWIRLALAVLGAILVHSAAFLAGVGEPLAIVVGLVAGPLIGWGIVAWAPLSAGAPVGEPFEATSAPGAPDATA